jgi:SpoVK/Ycf46/Vps4 family AAA+-type ATPase
MEMSKPEQKEVIQEGQIKSVAFFKSDVKFTDVIGLEKIKRYLADNVVLAIKKPDLFKKYGKKLGVGLLLYGPPGTGKTYIVRAVAGEAGANVIIARVNQIVDMYTGNTEKNLHAIFEQARKNTPCVIFFDELDALGVKRGGDEPGGGNSSALRLAVNQFLVEMSGVEANPEGIYVIGATNNPWDIDPALKRSGRFGDSVYLKPPDYKARRDLFKYYTRNKPVGRLDFGRLARATMGYSPADIERIADKAAMLPLLHEYEHNTSREYTMKDVLSILKDKDYSGSSLDEWYSMVKKDVITKTETQMVDGKKQEIVKEGKLDPQEKILYKAMVNDIKKNTNSLRIRIKKMIRWFALNLF